MSECEAQPRVLGLEVVLTLALGIAFSPSLQSLIVNWLQNPWSRYGLVFVPLVALCARDDSPAKRYPRTGLAVICAGMLLQLTAANSLLPALSRPAIVIGFVGLFLLRGYMSRRCAALALFITPVPYSLASDLGGISMASSMFRGAASSLGPLTANLTVVGDALHAHGLHHPIDSVYAGLPMLVMMAGLAWYARLRTRKPTLEALRGMWTYLAAALAFQAAVITGAAIAFSAGSPWAGEWILGTLWWLIPAALVIARTEIGLDDSEERAEAALQLQDS